MLRILLWKLGFEWANLKRIFNPLDQSKIYYFSFGANLSPEVLARRRIRVYESVDFILENAALRFSQRGFYNDHGYASADPVAGERVYGKMLLIRKSDAKRMDFYEGVPFLNVHNKVFGEFQGSLFYYYRAFSPLDSLKPTQEYLNYLTAAYRKMDCVPIPYIESMEATAILERYERLIQTGQFVRHIEKWPTRLHSLLVFYEGICQQIVEALWNRSLVSWIIKT